MAYLDYILLGFLGLLTAEALVAFIFYPLKNGKNYYSLMKVGGAKIFRYDSDLGYQLKPEVVYQNPTVPLENAPRRIQFVDIRTDKNGFSTTEKIESLKNNNKLIFCLGGSTTMGAESRHNYTYPSILDSKLKQYGYRCINCGIGGYRSIHELLYFRKKILPFKPHAIILFSGYNDFEDSAYNLNKPYTPHTHCLSQSLPNSRLEEFLQKSAMFFVIKRMIYFAQKKIRTESMPTITLENLTRAAQNRDFLVEWEENVEKIIDECKENNIKCFILSHASPCFSAATEEAKIFANKDLNMQNMFDVFVSYLDSIHKCTRALCERKAAHFIDVNDPFEIPFKKRFSLFTDRMHFTEKGNSVLAEVVFTKIKNLL